MTSEDYRKPADDHERPAVAYWIARARQLIAEGRAEFERRQAEDADRKDRAK